MELNSELTGLCESFTEIVNGIQQFLADYVRNVKQGNYKQAVGAKSDILTMLCHDAREALECGFRNVENLIRKRNPAVPVMKRDDIIEIYFKILSKSLMDWRPPCLTLTGMPLSAKQGYQRSILQFGGMIIQGVHKYLTTVIVTGDKGVEKGVEDAAAEWGIPIVSAQWLTECEKAGKLVPWSSHIISRPANAKPVAVALSCTPGSTLADLQAIGNVPPAHTQKSDANPSDSFDEIMAIIDRPHASVSLVETKPRMPTVATPPVPHRVVKEERRISRRMLAGESDSVDAKPAKIRKTTHVSTDGLMLGGDLDIQDGIRAASSHSLTVLESQVVKYDHAAISSICIGKYFQFGSFKGTQKDPFKVIIEKLGAHCDLNTGYDERCTHLIVPDRTLSRTEKFLSCVAAGKSILLSDYLVACDKAGRWEDEEPYAIGQKGDRVHEIKTTEPGMCFRTFRVAVAVADTAATGLAKILRSGGCSKVVIYDKTTVSFEGLNLLITDCNNMPAFLQKFQGIKQSPSSEGIPVYKIEFLYSHLCTKSDEVQRSKNHLGNVAVQCVL